MTRVVEGVEKETIRHHVLYSEWLHILKSTLQKDLLKDSGTWLKMTTGHSLEEQKWEMSWVYFHKVRAGLWCRCRQVNHASCVHAPWQHNWNSNSMSFDLFFTFECWPMTHTVCGSGLVPDFCYLPCETPEPSVLWQKSVQPVKEEVGGPRGQQRCPRGQPASTAGYEQGPPRLPRP